MQVALVLEGDALLFLRVYTDPHDGRSKHFVLLGALAASVLLPSLMPDDWWQLVAWIPFVVLLESLRTLPVHRGRRPPSPLGSARQPYSPRWCREPRRTVRPQRPSPTHTHGRWQGARLCRFFCGRTSAQKDAVGSLRPGPFPVTHLRTRQPVARRRWGGSDGDTRPDESQPRRR